MALVDHEELTMEASGRDLVDWSTQDDHSFVL